jgi:hypothetical protein
MDDLTSAFNSGSTRAVTLDTPTHYPTEQKATVTKAITLVVLVSEQSHLRSRDLGE